jgi:colicin import membrane protein
MNLLTALLLLTLPLTLSFAQAVDRLGAPLDILAERVRIQSERDAGEVRFIEQEAACYAKFAVTDCLQEVRSQRRHLNDDLRRQTVLLNDMERSKKVLMKMDQTELKSSSKTTD